MDGPTTRRPAGRAKLVEDDTSVKVLSTLRNSSTVGGRTMDRGVLHWPIAARAIRHYVLASRWDCGRAAFDTAGSLVSRAIKLAERLCPGDGDLKCELLLEQGVVHALAGERERARSSLIEAANLSVRFARRWPSPGRSSIALPSPARNRATAKRPFFPILRYPMLRRGSVCS